MSRLEPKNREEAFTYQFEDDVKVMRTMAFDEVQFNVALGLLEIHIAAYRNKHLKKRAQKTLKKSAERLAIARKKYPSLHTKR